MQTLAYPSGHFPITHSALYACLRKPTVFAIVAQVSGGQLSASAACLFEHHNLLHPFRASSPTWILSHLDVKKSNGHYKKQTFSMRDLKLLFRSHTRSQALKSIQFSPTIRLLLAFREPRTLQLSFSPLHRSIISQWTKWLRPACLCCG